MIVNCTSSERIPRNKQYKSQGVCNQKELAKAAASSRPLLSDLQRSSRQAVVPERRESKYLYSRAHKPAFDGISQMHKSQACLVAHTQ